MRVFLCIFVSLCINNQFKTFKMRTLQLLFVAFILILASCSMEKRVYNTGYHIRWKNNNTSFTAKETIKEPATETVQLQQYSQENNSDLVASAGNSNYVNISNGIHFNERNFEEITPVASNFETKSADLNKKHEAKKVLRINAKTHNKGVLMALLGLAMMGIGFILFSNLASTLGTIILILFGIGGLILFIIGAMKLIKRR